MQALLYKNSYRIPDITVAEFATNVAGAQPSELDVYVTSAGTESIINQWVMLARQTGAPGTPVVILNGELLPGDDREEMLGKLISPPNS